MTFQAISLAFVVVVSGCASNPTENSGASGNPPKATASGRAVVKPSDALTGKVVSYNVVGRFAVLNFPVTRMPAMDQTLFLYRDGLKVGEVKITGPQKDDNVVGDITVGDAKAGDEVRDR